MVVTSGMRAAEHVRIEAVTRLSRLRDPTWLQGTVAVVWW